jgi:hypothetical protein
MKLFFEHLNQILILSHFGYIIDMRAIQIVIVVLGQLLLTRAHNIRIARPYRTTVIVILSQAACFTLHVIHARLQVSLNSPIG